MYIKIYLEKQEEFETACEIIDNAFTYSADINYIIIERKTRTNVRKKEEKIRHFKNKCLLFENKC